MIRSPLCDMGNGDIRRSQGVFLRYELCLLEASKKNQHVWKARVQSTFVIPAFPRETTSQSKLQSTTPDSDGAELWADWDQAWDYTPDPDLTFLVFFECKHARHPTCRGLTPLFRKKRADPMLSDPNLPQLPLPTAISPSFPPVPFYISTTTFHSSIHPFICRGNLHLWLSPGSTITTSSPLSLLRVGYLLTGVLSCCIKRRCSMFFCHVPIFQN